MSSSSIAKRRLGWAAGKIVAGGDVDPSLFLTNEDFDILQQHIDGDDSLPIESTLQSSEPKRTRRSKKELETIFAKYAIKRKLSPEEMASFIARRRRKPKIESSNNSYAVTLEADKDPTAEEAAVARLLDQRVSFIELGDVVSSYDLDALQTWFEKNLAENCAFQPRDVERLPKMRGSIYFCLYVCVVMSVFPVCALNFNVKPLPIMDAHEVHQRLIDFVQDTTLSSHSSVSLSNTTAMTVDVDFTGQRIFYQSIWDLMADYIEKRLDQSRPLRSCEVHEMLHGDESVTTNFDRNPDDMREDGLTQLKLCLHILVDNISSLICGIEVVSCAVIVCPELDQN
jgi:hypothetical protein